MSEDLKVGDRIAFKGNRTGIRSYDGNRIVTAVGEDLLLYKVGQEEFYAKKAEVVVIKPFFEVGRTYYSEWGSDVSYKVISTRERDTEKHAWCEKFHCGEFVGMVSLEGHAFEGMRDFK